LSAIVGPLPGVINLFSIEEILDHITSLQSDGDKVYGTGLFPSQRLHRLAGYSREDNNIFFSALITFTLKQLIPKIPNELVGKAKNICEAVVSNYSKYQHYADSDTFNFWQKGKHRHFPDGWLLNKIPMLALPADADDTSIIYLTSPRPNKVEIVKKKLESQYTPNAPISPLTPLAYLDLRAYPTFMGKKILREMDVCVICNVMYMVCHYRLPWTTVDHQSIEFIYRVLRRDDHRKSSFQVSPHYGNPVIILYHIARLVGSFDLKPFNELRSTLVKCLRQELSHDLSFVEKVLVSSSLLRLQVPVQPVPVSTTSLEHLRRFCFFQAGMLTGFQNSILKWPAQMSFFHLKYRCEAYNWALLLEYLLLSGPA